MKTIIKQRLLTALLLMGLSIGQAQAWTFTTSGLITSGYDSTGVFGTANQDLTGLAYTQSLTLDPALYDTQYTGAYMQGGYFSSSLAVTGTATDTVTVNGQTHSYILDLTQSFITPLYDGAYLFNALTQGFGSYDEAYQYHSGVTTDGQYIISEGEVWSTINPLNIGLSYTQIWSYSLQPGDGGYAYFGIEGGLSQRKSVIEGLNDQAYFSGTPTFISINAATAVPEPTGLMLLALGLIGLTGRHRKFLLKA
jgi:PEP-CTERM motif